MVENEKQFVVADSTIIIKGIEKGVFNQSTDFVSLLLYKIK